MPPQTFNNKLKKQLELFWANYNNESDKRKI